MTTTQDAASHLDGGFTDRELRLARHALGLDGRQTKSYRNRFIVGPGAVDHDLWRGLVDRGLAEIRDDVPGQMTWFCLTLAGARAALWAGESLNREDFPTAARSALSATTSTGETA